MPKEFFKKIVTEGIVILFLAMISASAVFLFNRYFETDLKCNYDFLEIELPSNVPTDTGSKNSAGLVLNLFNNSALPMDIQSINIWGLEHFESLNLSKCDGRNIDEQYTTSLKKQMKSEEGLLTITDIPKLDSKRTHCLFVWGTFLIPYIEVKTDRGTYVPAETVRVSGIEKFFAIHWKLIVAVLIISAVLSFYLGKLNNKS